MKETIIRYAIVAALGAFICSISSCGTHHAYCAAYAHVDNEIAER